ncbi:MAG: SDR family oxidoreductase [Nitratireductor sp.]|nr:SDR family oxidoreductase [Nitratireductor sp.]
MSRQRTILVTGCSSGIGRHCALRLRDAGWRVFATARNDADIEALKGEGLEALRLDYADTPSIHAAFAETMQATGGRLDALFNNGAYGQPGAVEDLTGEVLRAQFEANFFGWHELTRLAVPVMRRQNAEPGWGRGRIVHCSSILGFVPYRWRGAYNASKFALEGLFLTQRMELMDAGIHMSLIEPGPIVSRFTENGLRKFLDNIDIEGSVHAERYAKELARLKASGGVNRFRLGPEAVYAKLEHALNAPRPRAQYPVTLPSRLMARIRGITPQFLMDRLLLGSD